MGEIHTLLDGAAPSIINAHKGSYKGPGKEIVINDVKWDEESYPSGFASQAFESGYITITVESDDNKAVVITAPELGVAPQMMFLPHDWWWPVERQNIKEVYPDFTEWVKNCGKIDWHLNHNGSDCLIDHIKHGEDCHVCH